MVTSTARGQMKPNVDTITLHTNYISVTTIAATQHTQHTQHTALSHTPIISQIENYHARALHLKKSERKIQNTEKNGFVDNDDDDKEE